MPPFVRTDAKDGFWFDARCVIAQMRLMMVDAFLSFRKCRPLVRVGLECIRPSLLPLTSRLLLAILLLLLLLFVCTALATPRNAPRARWPASQPGISRLARISQKLRPVQIKRIADSRHDIRAGMVQRPGRFRLAPLCWSAFSFKFESSASLATNFHQSAELIRVYDGPVFRMKDTERALFEGLEWRGRGEKRKVGGKPLRKQRAW
jgi:hypothetical protein